MALTLTPWPFAVFFDDLGAIIPGGKLFTYAAGTSNKLATYSDPDGAVIHAHTNPIILNSAGRVDGGIYLLPASYKFVLSPATDTDPPTNPIVTQDAIGSVPVNNVDNDVNGTAGEVMTAGQGAYLSDGSGGKVAGRWYLWSADQPYSSTLPEITFAVSDVSTAATGSFRLSGRITGLSALVAGSDYWISASGGALTATAPANARYVGRADSITSLVGTWNPRAFVTPRPPCGRLSLTTGVPVTTADVTGATTLFYPPYEGNTIDYYDGTRWVQRTFTQLSLPVPATTNTMYDVFVYDLSGTLTLELTAWSNDTTRATALTTQDGVFVKTGALTRLYLGSFRTTGVSGQTEDSFAKRFLWNYYHRIERPLRVIDGTANWTYTLAAFEQARAQATNQVATVIGVAEVPLYLQVTGECSNSLVGGAGNAAVGIGQGSTTTVATAFIGGGNNFFTADIRTQVQGSLYIFPAVGYQFWAWLESSQPVGTTTWYGDGVLISNNFGLSGWIEG